MRSKLTIACLVSLLAMLALPAAFADGTPNLGTAQLVQADSRWFFEGRFWDSEGDQKWYSNATYSLGFVAPVNENMEFGLAYSKFAGAGPDAVGAAVRESRRTVLAPSLKWRFTDPASSTGAALSVGVDAALSRTRGINTATGQEAWQRSLTPAARLQFEFGQPGDFQFQVAGQIADWASEVPTTTGGMIPGFGTVTAVGGGLCFPVGSSLTITGDAMAVVQGDNVVDEDTNAPDRTVVWSAGGAWAFGDSHNTTVTLFATNSMGPTLGSSVIAAPGNAVGFGAAVRRDF